MAVSGTVSQTTFLTRQVVDHAFRRCRVPTQLVTSEHLQIAEDCLYLLMSELVNLGIPLWCIEKQILALYEGSAEVTCPNGTVDVLNLTIRQLQRLTGATSASEGDPDNATDGDVETADTQTVAGGNITISYADEVTISNIGILPNATGTWNISVQTSVDGSTYTTVYANATFAAVNGEWQWIDLYDTNNVQEGAALNAILFVRLLATTPTILNVREFVVANNPSEIPLARINRDDYKNLPDKAFQGRPVQFWLDIQRDTPIIRIWPAVQLQYTFYQLILTRKRYLMDVGTLTQTLDFPQRWYEAVVSELAARLAMEVQEVDANLMPTLRNAADRAMRVAWTGEGDSSPVYFRVNLSPYTK
jgi:hypothetical protein